MKLVFAIFSSDSYEAVASALSGAGYQSTKLASTGNFLRRGNTTLMIGVDDNSTDTLNDKEVALIQRLTDYPATVKQAGEDFSPAVLCNYAYALAQEFNSFYHDYSILNEADERKKNLRLLLSAEVAKVLKHAMALLGIEMPARM